MNDPEYKDSRETNKAPFNLAYDTPLDYFQYTTTVRPDMGNRTQKAMGGKGFNLDQYLSRKSLIGRIDLDNTDKNSVSMGP